MPKRMSRACSRLGTRGSPSAPRSTAGALALDGDLDLLREGRAVAQVAIGAEVELPEIEREPRLVAVELEQQLGLVRDRRADAVAADDGDFLALRRTLDGFDDQPSARSTGHVLELVRLRDGPVGDVAAVGVDAERERAIGLRARRRALVGDRDRVARCVVLVSAQVLVCETAPGMLATQ